MTGTATTYDAFSQQPEYIAACRAFLETLPADPPPRAALDLACGTGVMTRLLLEQAAPPLAVVGVDIAEPELELARRECDGRGLLAPDPERALAAPASGRSAVCFVRHSADTLPFPDETFDLALMGNAIHLLPDAEALLAGIARVLRPGGVFAFNSCFFAGTYVGEKESVYGEWLKEAFNVMREKDAALRRDGKPGITRKRGPRRRAFEQKWHTPEEWADLLRAAGFDVLDSNLRVVMLTRNGFEAIGAYSGFAEVLMKGYPVDIAGDCLREAAQRVFRELRIEAVPRNWLEMTGVKRRKTGKTRPGTA
ncbi:MAG: class I SAM-dependent methyltransferase [Lentisphaerae bacterium]|nr:class I SAM-dependent methyltransferase [Lentisphaerota bacterium]